MHIPIDCFRYVSTIEVNMFSSETGEWGASILMLPSLLIARFYCQSGVLTTFLPTMGKFVWTLKNHGLFLCDPFDDPSTVIVFGLQNGIYAM